MRSSLTNLSRSRDANITAAMQRGQVRGDGSGIYRSPVVSPPSSPSPSGSSGPTTPMDVLLTPPAAPVLEVSSGGSLQQLIAMPRSPVMLMSSLRESGEDPARPSTPMLQQQYVLRYYPHDQRPQYDTEVLNSEQEIFGMEDLRLLLRDNILIPRMAPAYFQGAQMQPGHFMRVMAPPGAGLRSFCISWGRENHINVITLAQLIGQQTYRTGTYLELLQHAMRVQPCLVLLDRLEDHWSQELFQHAGAELIAAWQQLCEHLHPQVPAIYFVLSTQQALSAMHPQLLEYWIKQHHCTGNLLKPNEIHVILRRAFTMWLCTIGMQDDRVRQPTNLQQAQQQLAQSSIEQQLERYRGMTEKVAAAMGRQARLITPALLHNFVGWMFQSATKRFFAKPEQVQRFSSMTPQQAAQYPEYLQLRLPGPADYEEAVSKLPLKL
jgi:hypothetical protein